MLVISLAYWILKTAIMQDVRLLESRGSKVGSSNGLMVSKSVYKSGEEVHKNSLKISCRLPATEAIIKKFVLLSHLPMTR